VDHRHAGRPPRLWGAQALLQSHEHDPRGEHLAPVGRYRGVQARAGIIACAQYPRQSGGEPPAAARPGDPGGALLDERVADAIPRRRPAPDRAAEPGSALGRPELFVATIPL